MSYQANIVSINRAIRTGRVGHGIIDGVYKQLVRNPNSKLDIGYSAFIDGNLSAPFAALIYLIKKKNPKLFVDVRNCHPNNPIYRNGFTNYLFNKEKIYSIDYRASTVQLDLINVTDEGNFTKYIKTHLLKQRGLEELSFKKREELENNYNEIFFNVGEHARTIEPIFVCGQYFPKEKRLLFTLVDLGVGFLKPIMEFSPLITTAKQSIGWAVAGNTTRQSGVGGYGLKNLRSVCRNSGNELHIYSDGYYCEFNNNDTTLEQAFEAPFFPGTMIHLIINLSNAQ